MDKKGKKCPLVNLAVLKSDCYRHDMIKIGDVVQMLGVSKSTVSNWVGEYEDHFSTDAAGKGNRRHRLFTEHDVSILHTIATLRKQGQSFEDIRATLDNGKTLLPDLSLPQLAKLRKRELTEGFIEEIISEMLQTVATLRTQVDDLHANLSQMKRELETEKQGRLEAERRAERAEARLR